jgi:hypothetical protein
MEIVSSTLYRNIVINNIAVYMILTNSFKVDSAMKRFSVLTHVMSKVMIDQMLNVLDGSLVHRRYEQQQKVLLKAG